MHAIVNPFIQICLLRQGPQDLPTSGILLTIALTTYTVMSIVWSKISLNATSALLSGLLDTVLLVVLSGALLYAQRRKARLIQTLTALAGTGAIITFLALPVSGWLQGADHAAGEGKFAVLLLLVLMGWSLAVVGHIFRHALSVSYFFGLVLAAVFAGISIWAFRSLFPMTA